MHELFVCYQLSLVREILIALALMPKSHVPIYTYEELHNQNEIIIS